MKIRVCGLDECGRGALSGPLMAAGVVLNCSVRKLVTIAKAPLKDSKALNSKQRERIYQALVESGAIIGVEVISARQINNQGIGWANREIFRKLIRQIDADKYIVDGNLRVKVNSKSSRIVSIVKADTKIPEVIAASIVAKVTRDRLMRKLAIEFLSYGWENNVGYGTRYHLRAIEEYGVTRYHRGVFVTTALKKLSIKSF